MSSLDHHALAIANLKARYCALADLAASDPPNARAGLAELFTEDFSGDYGVATMDGPQAIQDFLCTVIAASSIWMNHMLSSPQIVVDGNRATGDWSILVWTRRREDGEIMQVIGRYSDEFRLTAAGWRIARVRFQQLV